MYCTSSYMLKMMTATAGASALIARGRVDAVLAGQGDVHENHIRSKSYRHLLRLPRTPRLPDNLDVGIMLA